MTKFILYLSIISILLPSISQGKEELEDITHLSVILQRQPQSLKSWYAEIQHLNVTNGDHGCISPFYKKNLFDNEIFTIDITKVIAGIKGHWISKSAYGNYILKVDEELNYVMKKTSKEEALFDAFFFRGDTRTGNFSIIEYEETGHRLVMNGFSFLHPHGQEHFKTIHAGLSDRYLVLTDGHPPWTFTRSEVDIEQVGRDNGRKSRVIRRGPWTFRRHGAESHL